MPSLKNVTKRSTEREKDSKSKIMKDNKNKRVPCFSNQNQIPLSNNMSQTDGSDFGTYSQKKIPKENRLVTECSEQPTSNSPTKIFNQNTNRPMPNEPGDSTSEFSSIFTDSELPSSDSSSSLHSLSSLSSISSTSGTYNSKTLPVSSTHSVSKSSLIERRSELTMKRRKLQVIKFLTICFLLNLSI